MTEIEKLKEQISKLTEEDARKLNEILKNNEEDNNSSNESDIYNAPKYVTLTVPLEQIAKKLIVVDGKERKLDIPAFQRGLVWQPDQVEALWDSIMRGIPIGCITIIKYASSLHNEISTEEAEYGIFDGQQRHNALQLGFIDPFKEKNTSSILWLDISPRKSSSLREFYFYVTTEGQPWGYKINDSGSEVGYARLLTKERQEALQAVYGENGVPEFTKPSCSEMWPYKAHCPVPVSILLNLAKDSTTVDEFRDKLICMQEVLRCRNAETIKKTDWRKQFCSANLKDRADEAYIELRAIYNGLKCALSSKVVVVISPHEFERKGVHAKENSESNVAVFFSRLNRGGSVPSVEEVNYSVLKSMVPSLKTLDEMAGSLMQPSRLASIAMRLFISESNLTSQGNAPQWKSVISRKDVIELAGNASFEIFVTKNFKERVRKLIDKLTYCNINQKGLPPYIISTFITKTPDLFLLFLLINVEEESDKLCAAFLLLGIYGHGISYKDALISGSKGIPQLIHDLAIKGQLLLPPSEEAYSEINSAVRDVAQNSTFDDNERLKALNNARFPALFKQSVEHTWWWDKLPSRMLLLYACRKYLDRRFPNYNPAAAVWNEDNRPWDYDHIIPQGWLIHGKGNPQGKWHSVVNNFINSIGNIAPVPFSFNRIRQDGAPYALREEQQNINNQFRYMKYENDNIDVFANINNDYMKTCPFLFKKPANYIEREFDTTISMAEIIASRMSIIYKQGYDLWGKLLLEAAELDDRLSQFEIFASSFGGIRPYLWCVTYTGKLKKLIQSHDFLRDWLAYGVPVVFSTSEGERRRGLICVYIGYGKIQWGISRHPDDISVEDDTNRWWLPNHLKPNEVWKGDVLMKCEELRGGEQLIKIAAELSSLYKMANLIPLNIDEQCT